MGMSEPVYPCPACKGEGEPIYPCPACKGEGVRRCSRCRGEGAVAGPFGPRVCLDCDPVRRGTVACGQCHGVGLRASVPESEWTPKVCTCCGTVLSAEAWRALRCIGVQELPDEPDLELRNCECGTTLAVVLPLRRVA
jgi:hypothetical protein